MNQAVNVQALQATANGAAHVDEAPRGHATWARSVWRRVPRALLAAGAATALASAGGLYIVASPSRESTDDAYVEADATSVAPKVRGLVAQVLVHDNETVHAGAPLVRIDAEEFDVRVASARADLLDAEAAVAAARAALTSLGAEESLAVAKVAAARTVIRSAQAQSERATTDRRRFDALVTTGAVPAHDADNVRAAAITAEQDVARAVALLDVAQHEASVTSAKRPLLEAQLQKADAVVARAQASLDLALQDQRHATIAAPIDGVVGNRQVQAGDYVQPGTRLLTLVPLHALYVTANFKETQIDRMHAGQPATIELDAFPGRRLTGRVESFAPGSGSQFSLLPFEPGTGNFTKIVQRVPVRIGFDSGQALLDQLRPGLSVTARIALE